MKVLLIGLFGILFNCENFVQCRPSKDACINGLLYPDSSDCNAYLICSNGVLIKNICPIGLVFNVTIQVCDWPTNTKCTSQPAPSTSVPSPTSTSTSITSSIATEAPGQHTYCPIVHPGYDVFLPNPECTRYYVCLEGIPYEQSCPNGLHFNQHIPACDYPDSAKCVQNAATEQPNAITLPPVGNAAEAVDLPFRYSVPIAPMSLIIPALEANSTASCPIENQEFDVFLSHPDCTRFYLCLNGIPNEKQCPLNLYWNQNEAVCDYADMANCVANAAPEQPNAITLPPTSTTISTTTNSSDFTPEPEITIPVDQACPSFDPEYDVFLPHPDCTRFYLCLNGIPIEKQCPLSLVWNQNETVCDYADNAKCIPNAAPDQPNAITLPPTPSTISTTANSSDPTTEPVPTLPAEQSCPIFNPEYDVFLPHPDCSRFYLCLDEIPFEKQCPPTLNWNQNLTVCDFIENSTCIPGEAPEQPNAITLPPTPSTTSTTYNSSEPTTEPGPTLPADQTCPKGNLELIAFLPHPDCTKYYTCLNGVPFEQPCPPGLNWNKILMVCDFPASAKCTPNEAPEQPNAITLSPVQL